MKEINQIPAFKNFCISIGNLPTAFMESMTYYEALVWLVNYLENTVIPAINTEGEAIQELQAAYVTLKNYVDTYFDNLDIQTEVNNKLDEMVEDGTLQEIMASYLETRAIFGFDTISGMKTATNLISGSYAKTLGFYSLNDGGGATYFVRDVLNTDTIDEITLFALSDPDLVAELVIEDSMSVKQFGAKGDGSNNDTTNIQAALNKCSKVYVPSTDNYYKINNSLTFHDGLTIYGDGEKSKILMPDDLTKTLFDIHDVKDITIDGIKLCNESCQTGSSPDLANNILIYVEDTENLNIKNCYFENAYSRGIEIIKSKNITYINNEFKNATFDMLMLLPEVENVLVDNSIFDTITSTYMNTYLFATGRMDTETYDFSVRDITVRNSKFLNNPNWEGIDSHGGNRIYIENNYISNCKIGIIAHYGSTAPITTEEVKQGDIYVRNNIIVNSSASRTYGIDVGVGASESFLCKNVVVENNYIDSYGSSETVGALHLIGIKYLTANNNHIVNSQGAAIDLTNILYADVIGNKCININSSYGINYVAGCWFINLKNNVIKNTTFSNTIAWGVRSSFLNISQFVDNDIEATNMYSSNGTIMSGNISSGTNQIGKRGNYVKNMYGIITYYSTDTVIRPAKTETLSSVSLSGTISTNIVTGTNALYYLTEGEEITLQGAGTGGADLTTVITEFISRDSFKVKDTILTTFSNQYPKTTAGTWTSV